MKLVDLQEQLQEKDLLLTEADLEYFSDFAGFLLEARKFGILGKDRAGLLYKGKEDFNPHEEMFIRNLSAAVEKLGGNVPKEKIPIFHKVIMSIMAPILGLHMAINFTDNISTKDIAYVLSKVDKTKLEQVSNRIKKFVNIARTEEVKQFTD